MEQSWVRFNPRGAIALARHSLPSRRKPRLPTRTVVPVTEIAGSARNESDMSVVTTNQHRQDELTMDGEGRRALRVLIADDHPLIIAGIRRTIEQAEDLEVV